MPVACTRCKFCSAEHLPHVYKPPSVKPGPVRRAFVPTVHLSDLGSKASRAKYKVGQEVRGRVLERDAASKRIVMTLKKALIGSKLPAIAHLEVR